MSACTLKGSTRVAMRAVPVQMQPSSKEPWACTHPCFSPSALGLLSSVHLVCVAGTASRQGRNAIETNQDRGHLHQKRVERRRQ
mmetsp:Transcript_59141/g.157387  ORF Transcript_59141/g.157387 Transcript_59141/m.157387 type:complete len:84 (-) Transcript_59141:224-475(-)